MVGTGLWTDRKVLITVRTYPTPSAKSVEVSCTAGITDAGEWIRLFPIPYRFLGYDKRFQKYQWVQLRVKKAADARPESYQPDIDSISILDSVGTESHWQARKNVVFPLRSGSLCELKAKRDQTGVPTLGLFKPGSIKALKIIPGANSWTPAELGKLRQYDLFEKTPVAELERIPYTFSYQFTCDEPRCPSHDLSCTDWEMAESYRRWAKRYGDGWEDQFRETYERQMVELNDTHFYVGTLAQHPMNWIIVGLFYPRSNPQLRLDLL